MGFPVPELRGRVRLPLRCGLTGWLGGGRERLLEVGAFDADASSDANGGQGAARTTVGPRPGATAVTHMLR